MIVVAFSRTAAYLGSADLTKRFVALLEGLAHKISAVVLFGNPYAARELPKVPRLVMAFEHGGVEEVALRILAGELEPKGKLPVSIETGSRPQPGA